MPVPQTPSPWSDAASTLPTVLFWVPRIPPFPEPPTLPPHMGPGMDRAAHALGGPALLGRTAVEQE